MQSLYDIISSTGSHSLWAFATFILGNTQFPQYTVVLMLDDIQVGSYHSDETGHITSQKYESAQGDTITILVNMFQSMKSKLHFLKDQFNSSEGESLCVLYFDV